MPTLLLFSVLAGDFTTSLRNDGSADARAITEARASRVVVPAVVVMRTS